jgi:hypothetical protein
MPYFLADFMKVNSELNCKWMLPIRVVISSWRKNVDFALVSVLPASLNIEKLDLLQNKLFWCTTAKLILKGLKIQKTYLQNTTYFIEKGSGTRQMMENFIERNTLIRKNGTNFKCC